LKNHPRENSLPVRRVYENTIAPQTTIEPLLDSDEAASLLKIHPKTLQRMARNGEIAGLQIGRLWRFRASCLDEWLTRQLYR
jgi:excisionase family DNA binding protein